MSHRPGESSGSSSTPHLLGAEAQVALKGASPDLSPAGVAPPRGDGERASRGRHPSSPGSPLATLVAQLERQAADAEQMQATAPVAAVLRSVLTALHALDAGSPSADLRVIAPDDRLLSAREVAERLGTSVKLVYRSAGRWPFTRHVGRLVRFSAAGLETWLARR